MCCFQDIIEFVHIVNISLQTLVPVESFDNSTSTNSSMSAVPILFPFPTELCQCPQNYTGPSCENCSSGFTRSFGQPTDQCITCNCSNQASDCDPITGICIDCQGNTEGDHCERCITGYYGDPLSGVECLRCECPLLTNNFSPTCFFNETDGQPTCDNCSRGYTGRNCELCMNGYYGNPLVSVFNSIVPTVLLLYLYLCRLVVVLPVNVMETLTPLRDQYVIP